MRAKQLVVGAVAGAATVLAIGYVMFIAGGVIAGVLGRIAVPSRQVRQPDLHRETRTLAGLSASEGDDVWSMPNRTVRR